MKQRDRSASPKKKRILLLFVAVALVLASIPFLGRHAFLGDGDTLEEALKNLEDIKTYLFQKYLAQGAPIPVYHCHAA